MKQTVTDTIKETVLSYLPDARVLLFGSHATGNNNKDSDYDLLVITPTLLTRKERLGWSSKLNRAIVYAINAPVDILLYSEDEILQKEQLPGHIVRSAIKEGISL